MIRLTDALRKIIDEADGCQAAQDQTVRVATEAVYLAELLTMAFDRNPVVSTFARLEFAEWVSEDRESMNVAGWRYE